MVELRSSGGRVMSRSQVRTFLGETVAMSRIRPGALTLCPWSWRSLQVLGSGVRELTLEKLGDPGEGHGLFVSFSLRALQLTGSCKDISTCHISLVV